MRAGSMLSGPVALFILLCFFLPWVSVSCADEDVIAFSGMELAAGKEIDFGFGAERTDGDPLLFAIPTAAFLSFFLALATLSKENGRGPAGLQLLIALAAVGVLGFRGWDMYDAVLESRGSMIDINLKVGLWGTAGGLIALMVGALMTLKEGKAPSAVADADDYSAAEIQHPVLAPGSQLSCAKCGAPFPHQVKFCPKCGHKQ